VTTGWLGLDWGNVPAWVGTIVTSTSVSIAAISYRRSVRDKERDQASRISAWIGLVSGETGMRRVLQVANGSDASIYEVSVKIPGRSDLILGEVPGKTTLTPDVEIPASSNQSRQTAVSASINLLGTNIEGRTNIDHISQEAAPEIEFRDGVGRWWSRNPQGRLQRITERTFKVSEIKTRMRIFGIQMEAISRPGSRNLKQSGNEKQASGEH
jgi:hypothetical protein